MLRQNGGTFLAVIVSSTVLFYSTAYQAIELP